MFSEKVILITGASSGIGAATALHFAKLGANLAITGRNVEKLNKVAQECEQIGNLKPLVLTGELTNVEHTKSILNLTIKHFKKLDVLVNNAGIVGYGSIENTSMKQYDQIFNVNVKSVYHLTMLAVPYLIETKGNIVNVSSLNGVRSFPNVLAYCMSKASLDQFTRCVALELASKHVRVNSVNPGAIETDIQRNAGLKEEDIAAFYERSKGLHPLGRVGNPEEVAEAIAFLASDSSSFITGVTLPVDAGRHAVCPR